MSDIETSPLRMKPDGCYVFHKRANLTATENKFDEDDLSTTDGDTHVPLVVQDTSKKTEETIVDNTQETILENSHGIDSFDSMQDSSSNLKDYTMTCSEESENRKKKKSSNVLQGNTMSRNENKTMLLIDNVVIGIQSNSEKLD